MLGSWTGVLGVLAILALAVLLSTNRRAIRPRVVASAFALQAGVAVFALYAPAGKAAIAALSGGVSTVIGYSSAGIELIFGSLSSMENGAVFAIHVLPIIIFFASLMSVLYHIGLMPLVVSGLGRALQFIIGTRPVESLNAAANIFVGMTEAPLAIKPYLPTITRPQLFAIMTSGTASVAGSVLAAYSQLGVSLEYLLAASFMAAPGGLLMAKIIMPDDPADTTSQDLLKAGRMREPHANVFMAAAVGAQDGVRLAVNVAGMLLAFTSLIALFNGLLAGLG
ncbi:MAG: NupC/NupG family nucleoside CNT transporter, partial [Caulobacterales bacterium]|nr:NupC/NupG family nucleoside CNT transporter [Caulobacterales bacterium]